MGCIYKIINKVNNKIYIGLSTKSAIERFKDHIGDVNTKVKENYPLYRAFKKYGIDNFKCKTIIQGSFNLKQLKDLEIEYIHVYKSFALENKNGYNLTKGGEGSLGRIHNDLAKLKMKNSKLGKKASSETKLKMSIAKKKNPISKEALLKCKNTRLNKIKNGYRFPTLKYVYQYDLDFKLIKIHDSIESAQKELKMCRKTIVNHSNTQKPHRNFIFKVTKEVIIG